MWSSIKNIYLPKSFEDAIELQKDSSTVFFAGGSYLVTEKDIIFLP